MISAFFKPQRPFRRLRSLHLSTSQSYTNSVPGAHLETCATGSRGVPSIQTPLRGVVIVRLAFIVSLVFISTICFCFIGANTEEEYYKKALTKIADTEPGVVLFGENVDVDVDEPSVTIRWSILACGTELVLPGSAGAHGSMMCGLPMQPLRIFVDNHPEPATIYDPQQIPFDRGTGSRRSIQNLVQFDSDHVLDVHKAHLYPFDSYFLSSTIRVLSETNDTVRIRRLFTIETTSSFDIDTIDTETYSVSDTSTVNHVSRDIDMHIARPASARIITIMLFSLNWIMAHMAGGLAYMCNRLTKTCHTKIVHLSVGLILIAIPQLRNCMPDAPGFDGVLIDTIGYFPQMIIVAGSAIFIFLSPVVKAIDESRCPVSLPPAQLPPAVFNQVPTPTKDSTTAQIAQYERDRLVRHMNGEYVFPPPRVEVRTHVPVSEPSGDTSHRRSRPFVCPARRDSCSSSSSDRTITQDSDWMVYHKVASVQAFSSW